MKLSEAIMLPSEAEFNPMVYLDAGSGCLLGQAFNVLTGRTDASCKEICAAWPWLLGEYPVPKLLYLHRFNKTSTGETIITHFASGIRYGHTTREQCADWVRQNEPQEDQAEAEPERAALEVHALVKL